MINRSVSFTEEKKRHKEGYCAEEAAVGEITFQTGEGWSLTFLCLTKVPGKTPHSHRVSARAFMQWAATLTFQTEHDSSLISPKQNCSFLLFSCGSPFPHNHSACPPFLVLSPGFSTPLAQADQTQTHWSWHIHSTLHLPPLLSPLTHTCTRSEWQQANFYTAGNCLATPPHFASPPSLPTSLDISLPHWHPPTLNPTPSPRPSEREAQPRSKTPLSPTSPLIGHLHRYPSTHIYVYICGI